MKRRRPAINESVRRRILAAAALFDGQDGCWEWAKARNVVTGYGQLSGRIDGKLVVFTAHRAIFEALHGYQRLAVLHRCNNPPCFNPEHLFAGKAKCGEAIHGAKLTAHDVAAIRASDETLAALSVRYGVSQEAIRSVRRRRTWKHIT